MSNHSARAHEELLSKVHLLLILTDPFALAARSPPTPNGLSIPELTLNELIPQAWAQKFVSVVRCFQVCYEAELTVLRLALAGSLASNLEAEEADLYAKFVARLKRALERRVKADSPLLGSETGAGQLVSTTGSSDRHKKPRKRACIPEHAKALLDAAFQRKDKPSTHERIRLAELCDLTPRQIRVWFTNKRMRSKEVDRTPSLDAAQEEDDVTDDSSR